MRKWFFLIEFLLCIALVTGLVGCGDGDDDGGKETDDDATSGDDTADDDDDTGDNDDWVKLTIQNLKAELNPVNNLSAYLTFSTSVPTIAQTEINGPGDHHWILTDDESYKTDHEVPVIGMYADSEYEFTVTVQDQLEQSLTGDPVDFLTGPLPANLPPMEIRVLEPDKMQPGVTVFNVYKVKQDKEVDVFYGLLLGVDNTGQVVWYKKTPYMLGNFTETQNGNLMHSIFIFFAVEMDLMLNVEDQWSVFQLHSYSMHHELFELPWGDMITFGSDLRIISGYPDKTTYNVVGDRIVWFNREKEVIKEWNMFDYLDPLRIQEGFDDDSFWRIPYFYIDAPKDWTHANGVVYDESDNSVIISLRNQSWLIKIDMETDELIWKLGFEGDFTMLDEGYWQYHQHAPVRLPNGNLLIYDNGNGRPLPPEIPRFSRVVEFEVDEVNMTVRQVWMYLDDPIYYAPFLGDLDVMSNGNILICDGGLPNNPYDPSDIEVRNRLRIKEITHEPEPETVFELYIDDPNAGFGAYNAVRIEDFYTR